MSEQGNNVKFEILMSCMHQSDFGIGYKSKVESDLLIINQCDREGYEEIKVGNYTWRMISTTERGLSKSRNMALANAKGEICLLADDDEIFCDGYANNILDEYEKNKKADAIIFNLNREGKLRQSKYFSFKKPQRIRRGRGYSSCSISFKLECVKKNCIRFDERFGSGTQWGAGEDTLFIKSFHDNKMRVYGNPKVIATVFYGESLWFFGFDEKYYYNSGAFWKEYYGKNALMRELRFLYYAMRSSKKAKLSSKEKMRLFRAGARGFKKGISYTEYKDENSLIDKRNVE